MAKETPTRRAWLEKLSREGCGQRPKGKGSHPGAYCMQQGWTEWAHRPGSPEFDGHEKLTDLGRVVLARWQSVTDEMSPIPNNPTQVEPVEGLRRRADRIAEDTVPVDGEEYSRAKFYIARDAALAALTQASEREAKLVADNERLREALKPFAKHLDEMKFDLNHKGEPLPDSQTVGWVYLTNGDFRRARQELEARDGR